MDLSAAHAGFTVMAYIISGLALLGLAGAVLLRSRNLRRQLGTSATARQKPGDA